ncbi:MAG: uncharacterized protein QG614_133 [Patescibacteria group bacterium]|nr:uncharacterized protein [Patescibacteria group bacterium]
MALETNQFFDISKLPQEEGIIFWGISMNRIGNEQSAKKCFEYLKFIDTKIKRTDGIGMVTWYSDYLYFLSDEKAHVLRDRYKELMMQHKHGFLDLILKDNVWIKKAFSFYTFGQVILDNSEIYKSAYDKIYNIYKNDVTFQEYVDFDCKKGNHGLEEKEKIFILEEIVTIYLAAKGQLNFNNRFIQGTEQWVLQLYPGRSLKSEIYLFQLNPLKLFNPKNKFENSFYDLKHKVLYDYTRIDIDTFDFSEKDDLNIDFEQEKDNLLRVEIKNIEGKGKGLITKKDFKKDEVVFEVIGNTITYATDYTIPINETEKVEPRLSKSIAQYMNHSCEPNIYPSKDGRKYLAMKYVEQGEELVTNYAFLGFNFGEEKTINGKEPKKINSNCHCGFKNCKGKITAYNDLIDDEKEKYKDFVLPFLNIKKKL